MPRVPLAPGQVSSRSAAKETTATGASRWRARCRIGSGTGVSARLTATGPTRQAALDALDQRIAEFRAAPTRAEPTQDEGVLTRDSTVDDLLTEWWSRYRKRDRSPTTLAVYESVLDRHVRPRFGDLAVRDCTVPALDTRVLIFEEETGLRSGRLRTILKQALDLALRHGLVAANPMDHVEPPPPRRQSDPRALTPAEWTAVKEAIRQWGDASKTAPRDATTLYDVVQTCAATGWRISEVLALRPCDLVGLDSGLPRAFQTGALKPVKGSGLQRLESKAKRSHVVVLPPFVLPMLRARVEAAPSPESPVFPSANGTWVWPSNLRRQWRAARDLADLHWVTPHVFRKTVATTLSVELGSQAAADQLGHRSTRTTRDHYIAIPELPRDAQASADAIERALGDGSNEEGDRA